jgi:hypothetical protein
MNFPDESDFTDYGRNTERDYKVIDVNRQLRVVDVTSVVT